jgi:Rod binding domain-containing protein
MQTVAITSRLDFSPQELKPAKGGNSPTPAEVRKVVEAAHQFEAAMLESFLQPMEKAFSTLPGGNDENGLGVSGFSDMGTQAMASAISQAGGIGIADMLVRNLLHLQKVPGRGMAIGTGGPNGIKGFSPYADSN